MLPYPAEADKGVLVDKTQNATFPLELQLHSRLEIYQERIILEDHSLDKVCLVDRIGAPEEQKILLVLKGQKRGDWCGIGRERCIIATISYRLPFLVIIVEPFSMYLLDLRVAGQSP